MITYFVYFFFSSFTSSRIPRREPDYSYTVYFSQNNTIAVITTAETERGEIMSGGIKAERVCVYENGNGDVRVFICCKQDEPFVWLLGDMAGGSLHATAALP